MSMFIFHGSYSFCTIAIWAAARVPDDSVAVVANMFSIRTMDMEGNIQDYSINLFILYKQKHI